MNSNQRIELHDDMMTIITKLGEGNPGAITTLVAMANEGASIDRAAGHSLFAIFGLDSLGIYGAKIWLLYNDVCGRDLEKMLGVLRANQLGMLSEKKLLHAIDNRGDGIDVDDLARQVKEHLGDRFGRV